MPGFDRSQLEAIIYAVCEQLDGEWLIVGGAIASLWFDPRRTTEDVDIIGIQQDPRDRSALFDLGTQLGIPLEAMSSAEDYFVFRISDWRDHLVPFRTGTRGTVYRPTATLFLLLKLRRLDERDQNEEPLAPAVRRPAPQVLPAQTARAG